MKPWGTAHAVAACRDAVNTPFAVINADDFYGPSAFHVLGDFLQTLRETEGVHEYCLVGYLLGNTLSEHGHVSRGVCQAGSDGTLLAIHERVKIQRFGDAIRHTEDGETWIDLPDESVVSMNMWGFTPSLFEELDAGFVAFLEDRGSDPKAEYFLPERVSNLITAGRARVKILRTEEKWFGITYKEDKPLVVNAVRDLVEKGLYPPSLWETLGRAFRSIRARGFAMETNAVLVNPKDNIAVVIKEIKAGEPVTGIGNLELKANEDIMRNHKVAIAEVAENEPVLKYGERIGFASKPIRAGDWVHSHNMKWEED